MEFQFCPFHLINVWNWIGSWIYICFSFSICQKQFGFRDWGKTTCVLPAANLQWYQLHNIINDWHLTYFYLSSAEYRNCWLLFKEKNVRESSSSTFCGNGFFNSRAWVIEKEWYLIWVIYILLKTFNYCLNVLCTGWVIHHDISSLFCHFKLKNRYDHWLALPSSNL